MKKPPLGWTTPVKLKRVLDGDTASFYFEREFVVRITDDKGTYNTPETNKPASQEEISRGLAAKKKLEELLSAHPDEITLHIPTDISSDLKDWLCIGARVVGRIFVKDVDVTDLMTEAGFNVTLKKK